LLATALRAHSCLFFFQAEDGIRDRNVTGVQTCALPISTPEKIFQEVIDPVVGLSGYQARRLAFNINVPTELINKVVKFMMGLYEAFVAKDCSIAEINQIVTTNDGNVLALDAKFNLDDYAL